MSNNENYRSYYPGYWVYNAGLVGIIRTLKRFNKIKGDEYRVKDSALYIRKNFEEDLVRLYIQYMEEIFGFNWFFSKIAKQSNKGGIFTNNPLINGLKLPDDSFFSFKKKDDEILKDNNFPLTQWRLIHYMLHVLKKHSKKDFEECDDSQQLKSTITNTFIDLKKQKKTIEDFEMEFFTNPNQENHTLIKSIISKLALDSPEKWQKLWDENDQLKPGITQVIENLLFDRIKENSTNKKSLTINSCSFCGMDTSSKECFETKWFSYEGGSTEFGNFYYQGISQLIMCPTCQLVIYFSPLGIFQDSQIEVGEFINVPNIKMLWDLNQFRMGLEKTADKLQRSPKGSTAYNQDRLINAVLSTGALLQLKSRWVLQNIELLTFGVSPKEPKRVYSIDISPIVLNLLSDYQSSLIPKWLSQVEKIAIEKPWSELNLHQNSRIYTYKFTSFTKGRTIIERFLANDIGWLTNISVLLFKLQYEKQKKHKDRDLNDFNHLIIDSLKPILLLCLSLIQKKEASSESWSIAYNIARAFLKQNDASQFKKVVLSQLFNCVYTLRKTNFVEIILKIYIDHEMAVDEKLLDFLRLNDCQFQIESMLLLIGILDKINNGEKDE